MILQKTITYLLVLTIASTYSSCNRATSEQEKALHSLNISTADDLKNFFKNTENKLPLISGHRGGMAPGYPENSIATFEHTLSFTPVFFEIDPRLTKDSVIVLMHDVTLDRTTTGTGKVADYTLDELKQLKLKDLEGNPTDFHIPTLQEAIEWSRGKTVLNLDKKDVPLAITANIISENNAEAFVIVTVHTEKQAKFYLEHNKYIMFSAFVKTKKALEEYEAAGIPWENVAIAYVGPRIKAENKELYEMLHERGVKFMISTASSDDKLEDPAARKRAWRELVKADVDVIESDRPIEVAEAIRSRSTLK